MGKKRISEAEWIERLSSKSGVTENLTEQVWNSFLELIVEEVNNSEDKSFYIPKFGTFFKATHKGHPLNLNIKNGSKTISDYETFKFKVGSTFKNRVLNKILGK